MCILGVLCTHGLYTCLVITCSLTAGLPFQNTPTPFVVSQVACRQPLLAGQCCQLCNASDWSAISWSTNLTDIQQADMPITVGSTVTLLSSRLTVSNSSSNATSFKDVFLLADLTAVCQADQASCTQPVRWLLGSWGTCSSSCGGGVSTRTAACINADTGEWERRMHVDTGHYSFIHACMPQLGTMSTCTTIGSGTFPAVPACRRSCHQQPMCCCTWSSASQPPEQALQPAAMRFPLLAGTD